MLFVAVVVAGQFPVLVGDAAADPSLEASHLGFPGLVNSAPLAAQTEIQAAPVPVTVVAPEVTEGTVLGVDDRTAAELATLEQEAQAGSVATGDLPVDSETRTPIYIKHLVLEGDTVSSIAEAHGLGNEYLTWNNVDLTDPNRLTPGDLLIVPLEEGIVHRVQIDETVSSIARRYDAKIQDIVDFGANQVPDPSRLQADTLLFVPGGRIVPVAASIRPGPIVRLDQTGDWYWPGPGRITSEFTAWHPLGIDIGMSTGTPIVASKAGVIQFVGGDPWVSYGLHVIIDHGNGLESTYAHLSGFAPHTISGEAVGQGTVIGYSGNTGRSTGPHVHFEIRLHDVPQSPIPLLNQ